jgi:hypothetical protein
MNTDKREGVATCVYARRSPRKVTTQWQQVSRQPLAPTPQLDRVVLTEKAALSPRGGKDRLAGRVLLAGWCSTGLPEMCTKIEHVSRQPLASTLQPNRATLTKQEVPTPGKVRLAGVQVAGSSSLVWQETCIDTGSEQAEERKIVWWRSLK